YFAAFLGASPNFLPAFFMAASKFLRAFSQALSLRGMAHSPLPLHVFSPGCSPQPPSPAQSFMPLHLCSLTVGPWAWPAQSFVLPATSPLQVGFNPRQMCGSWRRSGFLGSFGLGLASSAARIALAPASKPPIAAAASLVNSRRFRSGVCIGSPIEGTGICHPCPPTRTERGTSSWMLAEKEGYKANGRR